MRIVSHVWNLKDMFEMILFFFIIHSPCYNRNSFLAVFLQVKPKAEQVIHVHHVFIIIKLYTKLHITSTGPNLKLLIVDLNGHYSFRPVKMYIFFVWKQQNNP